MKRLYFFVVCIFTCLIMDGCSIKNEEVSLSQKYRAFLRGEEPAYCADGRYIYCDDELKKTDGSIEYTLVDMTGDDVPELHVIGRISYLIILENDDVLQVWYQGSAYEKLLNNHAILYTRYGTGVDYKYIEFSEDGNDEEIEFSEMSMSEKEVLHFFDGHEISQVEYEELVLPFLSIKDDKIKWIVFQSNVNS